jgi:GNAT superfamily N-acetyltransferase
VQPTFTAATPADVPLLLQMIGELAEFEKLAQAAVGTVAELHEGLFGVTPKAEAILARLDGEVVGFALFFSNYSTFLCRPGLYLEDLYIRPAYRAQGIGRAFLQHIARLALARGCGRFEWSVLNWNASAIQFYQSMGAQPVTGWTVYRLDQTALERFRDTN